jgi:hypothetical protein
MLHRKDPFTQAEHRYVALREALESDAAVERYVARRNDDYGGSTVVDRFPAEPYLLIRFKHRPAFHRANLKRLATHPDRLRVIRTAFSSNELEELAGRIVEDAEAGDGFLGGYGAAGLFVDNA